MRMYEQRFQCLISLGGKQLQVTNIAKVPLCFHHNISHHFCSAFSNLGLPVPESVPAGAIDEGTFVQNVKQAFVDRAR